MVASPTTSGRKGTSVLGGREMTLRVTSNKIETVTSHLEQRIQRREWAVNESLPPQGQLSREYGVSPGTIAIALRNLKQKRLVNIVSNKGVYVLGQSEKSGENRTYPLISLRGSYLGAGEGTNVLVGGIVEVANAENCPLLLLPKSSHGEDYDAQYYEARGARGVIFLGGEGHPEALRLRMSGFPVILANKPMESTPLNYVDYDHKDALKHITRLFLENGHRKIAVIFPQTSVVGYYEALMPDFFTALAEKGNAYNVRDYWRCVDAAAGDSGEEIVRQLLALPEPPTAIFAWSPKIAAQVMVGAANAGVRVPEDLSVAASCYGSEVVASVSGFVLPHQQLGECLLHELHATIENPFHCVQKLLPLSFIDRQTIAPKAL